MHNRIVINKPFVQKARAAGIRYDAILVDRFLEAVGE